MCGTVRDHGVAGLRRPTPAFALEAEPGLVEIWTYELTADDRRLLRRHPIALPPGLRADTCSISPDGAALLRLDDDPGHLLAASSDGRTVERRGQSVLRSVVHDDVAVLATVDGLELAVGRLSVSTVSVDASVPKLALAGSRLVRLRRAGGGTVVCDERGRVIVLDDGGRITRVLLAR